MRSETARVLLVTICLASAALLAAPSGASPPDADADASVTTESPTTTASATANETADYGVVALYETDDGEVVRETVLTPDDVAEVGAVERDSQTGTPYVPVTLTETGTENFTEAMLAAGFGDGGNCRYESASGSGPGECLLTVVDGEVVYSAGVQAELGEEIRSGAFAEDPRLIMTTENESQAESLRAAFVDGESAAENETATAAATATTATTTADAESDGADGSVPGLTGPAALAALVLALLGALAGGRPGEE